MTANQIITDIFSLYTDDTTELSATEELALLNRVYKKICSDRPYEFLKKNVTGAIAAGGVITLPTDFLCFADNKTESNEGDTKVIYVNGSPYKVVSFSERKSVGGPYLDLANSRIVFTDTSITGTYDFDYIKIPADLAVGEEPIFPSLYHPAIGYGMATDGFVIQLFDKAKSYAKENQTKYDSYIADLDYWNASLINN